jgi:hypothetical protein
MIRFSPTIEVKRLIVKKPNKTVYDELFHSGLNILSGCNGGGKTSVIQLLLFGLGYEVKDWKDVASKCNDVYVELKINGVYITFLRCNLGKEKQAINICFKPYKESILSGPDEWKNFPYAISSTKERFSQKIFSLMGIPEAKADPTTNITFHQLLRLLYSDQSNPSGNIFNFEMFDSALKRDAIGNYLLGINDDDLHNAKMKQQVVTKRLEKVINKLKAIFSIIGKTSFPKNLTTIEEHITEHLDFISNLQEEIKKKKNAILFEYKSEKQITENMAIQSVKTKTKLYECE